MADLNDWAEMHGEPRMTMKQFEAEEARAAAEREANPTDEELYLEVVAFGEPYDLDECVNCGNGMAGCWCDSSRCLICSVWSWKEDDPDLCDECIGRVEYLHKEGRLP